MWVENWLEDHKQKNKCDQSIELEQALRGYSKQGCKQEQSSPQGWSETAQTTLEASPGDTTLGPAADSCVRRKSPGLALSSNAPCFHLLT